MTELSIGGDKITVYNVEDFFQNVSRETLSDGNTFATFDIETTLLEKYEGPLRDEDGLSDKYFSVMYLWQMCIGNDEERYCVVGRTWEELLRFVEKIPPYVWYIHNLEFEFQFLQSIFTPTKVFATGKRKPVRVTLENGIELRCSYKMSNMSLKKFCQNEGVEHLKQENFDYRKKRFSDTELSDDELLYGVCDVLGLHEAISHSMKYSNDNLKSIPYTSTGYVRRDAREEVKQNYKNRLQMLDRKLTENTYRMCKAAARGGNTHANPLYTGLVLGEDSKEAPTAIISDDKSSSYPYEMITGYYPMGKWINSGVKEVRTDLCSIVDIIFDDLQLKEGVYCAYISHSKCLNVAKEGLILDNGRIFKCAQARMIITEIDYNIIVSQYDFSNITILSQISAGRGYLCKEYRDFIYECYKQKCILKGGDEYFYNKYKNKINSLFGMMLTDICREEITYNEGEWDSALRPINELLEEYYKKWNSFLSYQDGVYVVAHARRDLQVGIDLVGPLFVYCDTDSVKHMSKGNVFDEVNVRIKNNLLSSGYDSVSVNGKEYTLGVWERDAEYSAFVTLGAKKYAYRQTGGDIGITVAGLSKDSGKKYLESCGGLSAFRPGQIFDMGSSGRLTSVYDDELRYIKTTYEGHPIEITSNVSLIDTTYTLGVSTEYNNFLNFFHNSY